MGFSFEQVLWHLSERGGQGRWTRALVGERCPQLEAQLPELERGTVSTMLRSKSTHLRLPKRSIMRSTLGQLIMTPAMAVEEISCSYVFYASEGCQD